MTIPAGAVVVDAMGGDHAPSAALDGAAVAAGRGVDVVLCGDASLRDRTDLPVVVADGVVGMDEDAAMGLRRLPDASIRVAARTVADAPGSVLLSAGSTGATVGAALLELGRLDGVRRPVVAARVPLPDGGTVVLLDVGADPDPQPEAYPTMARLGAAHARAMGVDHPRVGLLNMGVEPRKGTRRTIAAEGLLAGSAGFVGNVEPADVLRGAVDVVVCDGFTGNLVLKTIEGLSAGMSDVADRRATRDRAAHLLGVRGTVLVMHGAATGEDFAEAVSLAARCATAGTRQ
ncbi:Phosphate:acyl-ACP acyltransferase PlsX [Euzebya pacifica]|uniref:Phosphate acyltransferase n=1 Tax=Euzebya pacifica TaxID=1608957 RepID=A0A346Y0Y2_9ACTN|nr:phosphate acyltransferase PlsX [Euzebya pacifica]AXV08129.1 Phosphate:acyl-ACP acyltransferase PlsX [Euzebya pacifica]